LDSLVIDDDGSGNSSGNGDGIASPGEILELGVLLKNYGSDTSADRVTVEIENINENATILQGVGNHGDIAPGESRYGDIPYLIGINPLASNGDLARLRLVITDSNNNTWNSILEIPISAPKFVVTSVVIPEGDSVLNAGETANFRIEITNIGAINAENVKATVTIEDDYARLLSDTASFGFVAIDSFANNGNSLISINCDSTSFEGHKINMILHTETGLGSRSSVPFTISIGRITRNDPTGPDAYGYYMYDTRDSAYAMMPTYEWVEISPDSGGFGTRLNYGSNTDDKSLLVRLPFDFKYYGQAYGSLIVSINGFVAVDTVPMDMAAITGRIFSIGRSRIP